MNHLPLRECGYAIVFVLLLSLLYGGAYLAMLDRVDIAVMSSSVRPVKRPSRPIAFYHFGGDTARSFFWLAHRADRQLRPDLWENEFEPAPGEGIMSGIVKK